MVSERWNPFATHDVEMVNTGRGGAVLWTVATDDEERMYHVERWLTASGYVYDQWDRGDGVMVDAWKFVGRDDQPLAARTEPAPGGDAEEVPW